METTLPVFIEKIKTEVSVKGPYLDAYLRLSGFTTVEGFTARGKHFLNENKFKESLENFLEGRKKSDPKGEYHILIALSLYYWENKELLFKDDLALLQKALSLLDFKEQNEANLDLLTNHISFWQSRFAPKGKNPDCKVQEIYDLICENMTMAEVAQEFIRINREFLEKDIAKDQKEKKKSKKKKPTKD